jgi:hypothetical protein
MAWHLTGQFMEICSCNVVCPCWFGVKDLMKMDQGWCRGVLTIRIQQGEADGMDIGGLTVIIMDDFPGPTLMDANGRMRVYIDEDATAEQYRVLEEIFTGKRGGPMEALGALTTEWLPTRSARIEVREDGDTVHVTLGEVGQVRSQLLRDPAGTPFTLRGGGFISWLGMDTAEVAPGAGTHVSDPDIPSFEARSGLRGAIRWSA